MGLPPDARLLDRHGAIAYATESMRLTTRLMQLASWLLLPAIAAGEMTGDEARKEKHRISLSDIGRGNPLIGSEQLPDALMDLVERSLRLHMRVQKLDAMLNVQAKNAEAAESPVNRQFDRLASALKVARG
jgi:regulator of CtrA degradation